MKRRTWDPKQISVVGAALVLGVLVSTQWSASGARATASLDQVSRTIRQLELEQEELKQTVARFRERLDARQQAAADEEMLQDLRTELTEHKMQAGLIGVRGPGVQVILDDSPDRTGANPDELLIHDYDLRDVITVLWLAGAEAMSVNGERIVNNTSVYCVGSTVMVNDTRLSPPYQISAVGDTLLMQDHLRNPGYLGDLKARATRYGLRAEFVPVEMITIPAYRGSLPQRYAQPGS